MNITIHVYSSDVPLLNKVVTTQLGENTCGAIGFALHPLAESPQQISVAVTLTGDEYARLIRHNNDARNGPSTTTSHRQILKG